MVEKMMTTDELAEYVNVPVHTIYRWIQRGNGPKRYKVGIHNRFRRSDVDSWLEARATGGDKPAAA